VTPHDFERLVGRNVVDVLGEVVGLNGKPAMTPEQTFTWLGIGRTAGYEALRRGEIPSIRVGGRILCPTPALLLWLLEVTPNAEAPAITGASAQVTPTASNSAGRSLEE
jgi:hypothetical protein